MRAEDRYDSVLCYWWQVTAERFHFDDAADWRLLKAMALAAPDTSPLARLHLSARPDGAIDPARDAHNPEETIREAVEILAAKWSLFRDVAGLERWRFAVGAVVGGERDILRVRDALKKKGMATDQWTFVLMLLAQLASPESARATATAVRSVFAQFLAWSPTSIAA